tara:strand:- start:521 stop:1654 length:1134 start_codon:yes stop_codon:yes gene_type:complete
MKKNILTVFLSVIITIIFLYFVIFLKVYFEDYTKERPFLFKSLQNLNFHMKYSEKMHHLRDNNRSYGSPGKPKNFLFTSINKFSSDKKNILLQGDSWIEQGIMQEKSKKKLVTFAKEKNYGLINAGISSFSPSLMMVQYEVLEKDFSFRPNIVVAYIDQTDLGDENCRYKKNRIFDKNGNLISIKSESYTRKLYDLIELYTWSEILLSEKPKIVQKFQLTNFLIKFKTLRLLNKISDIKELGWENRFENRCFFKKITNYLKKPSDKESLYFQERLTDYINFLKDKSYIEEIILVTFPHKNHFISKQDKNYYLANVSNIVEKLILNEKKIRHLNFSKLYLTNEIQINQKFFEIGDPASHLKEDYHANVFLEKILQSIK